MKVLVIGSGGREHALCWALKKSPLIGELYAAPGNGGMSAIADCVNIPVSNHHALVEFCGKNNIDFVVVGPEQPLVEGLVDELEEVGIAAFGPNRAAAILEGSKSYTKDFCSRHKIPTAAYRCFSNLATAEAYIQQQGAPIVVKADGLAAGKGAIVCATVDEALAAAQDVLGGLFGHAGSEIVVEDFMVGEEASLFALCDGKTALPLVGAQDHKQVGDGDTGPNTGGMGAYSPAPVLDDDHINEAMERIILPTLEGMAAEGRAFKGVLYAGLIMTDEGPKLIEYNVRFGDPECQVIMARLDCDLLPALQAAANGTLDQIDLKWRDEHAVCVVMAAKGYPGNYEKGTRVAGLDQANAISDVTVFHAGTEAKNGEIFSNGGRVLGVTATAGDIEGAVRKAYHGVDLIDWPEGFCRRDIAWRAIKRVD
jgi:phosphoribosylamine--glycine ligase